MRHHVHSSFGETDVRPGGFVVLDDGTCLFAAYNRFGTLGRITLSKKLGAGGAEYWVQDDVEYVAQLPEHAALLHLQVNDLTKCTAALGKAAEADVEGCDVYLVGSANDFGGEAEANSVKGRYKRHSQMDKIIWAKNVRLKKEASSDGIIGYYGEDETSMRDGLVHVRAPTQKSWIHRVTQIKKPGGKMFLAATELRKKRQGNNRVLIISPPDVGPFHPEDAELRDVLISHAHSQSGEGLAVNGGINAQFQQLVRDFMKDMPTTTHKLVDHIFSPSKEDLVTTSDIDLSEDEDASPSTKLTEKIDPQENVDVLVEKFRHKYRRRFPNILERFPGGHKTHTHEAPIIEPGERQQEPFVPIVGRAVYPRGWLSEASKMEVDQHVH